MRAVRLLGSRRAEVIDRPDPVSEGDEVVVEVRAAAICGSDLHGLYRPEGARPWVPGHEAAGVVVGTAGRGRFREGDRVVLTAFKQCGACEYCRAGYAAYCRAMEGVYGFTRDGAHAQRVRVAERSLLPLPDSVPFEAACLLIDPIGTPFHAAQRVGLNGSHVVGVFGLGPMGLGAVMVARRLGAMVIGIDPVPFRRALAEKLGAERTVDPSGADAAAAVRKACPDGRLDRAFECSGSPQALWTALELVRPFGHVAIIGEQRSAAVSPSDHFNRKEITLSGSCCFPLGEYDAILRMLEGGLDPTRLVTHRFSLEEAAEAYRVFDGGMTGKVLLIP